ncbi:hypothetical protein [Burkholderia pseudomallei]|uniref:hypothetical protein n=1 Tax=Burkholderia pseudomallei TaxID=28450 RepID=UPI002180C672|nr:hypothetical protein [Burkholderia pseudomallei]
MRRTVVVREADFEQFGQFFAGDQQAEFAAWIRQRGGLTRSDSFLRFLSGTSEAIMLPI